MDGELTVEERTLVQAERQTAALESLRGIALVWTAFAAIGLVLWLLIAVLG